MFLNIEKNLKNKTKNVSEKTTNKQTESCIMSIFFTHYLQTRDPTVGSHLDFRCPLLSPYVSSVALKCFSFTLKLIRRTKRKNFWNRVDQYHIAQDVQSARRCTLSDTVGKVVCLSVCSSVRLFLSPSLWPRPGDSVVSVSDV